MSFKRPRMPKNQMICPAHPLGTLAHLRQLVPCRVRVPLSWDTGEGGGVRGMKADKGQCAQLVLGVEGSSSSVFKLPAMLPTSQKTSEDQHFGLGTVTRMQQTSIRTA